MAEALFLGCRVRLSQQPPYFKTAEPMPMLRPPDVVQVGEEGTIKGQQPEGYWVVHFQRGDFLVDAQYLESLSHNQETPSGHILPVESWNLPS